MEEQNEAQKKEYEFIDVKQAAAYMKVSQARVYQIKATVKGFPYHKIGEKILFEKNELANWILSQ